MSERLPIPAARVADVANDALVSKLTVLRYRRRNDDGTPTCHLLRATEAAITKAAWELPKDKQLEIPSVAGQQPPKRLLGVSPNMGQPGEVRSCPVGLDDCTSPTPTRPTGRPATIPKHCRVTVLDEHGQVILP